MLQTRILVFKEMEREAGLDPYNEKRCNAYSSPNNPTLGDEIQGGCAGQEV